VIETVSSIASQCDGLRCDMAMLLLNQIFERTWGSRAGQRPSTEYWGDVVPAIKKEHPDFRFIAEAYWDLEWELQQRGFDFCYDKRLYDRLEHENAESVRLHLCADLGYQEKLLRFLENHDEPRAAAAFPAAKEKAAAVTVSTLPGARLFHEGQFEGVGYRSFWEDDRQNRATQYYRPSTTSSWQPSMLQYFAMVNGSCASVAAGPTIKAFKTWWPGAGSRTMIDVS